jgi:hypothetical protein
MIEQQLRHELDRVASRYRTWQLWRNLALAWLTVAIAGAILLALLRAGSLQIPFAALLVAAVGIIAAAACAWKVRTARKDYHWLAQQIEAAFPDLNAGLLAAIEQRQEMPYGRLGFLQETVVREALAHARNNPWQQIVPTGRIVSAELANVAALALLLAVIAGLAIKPPRGPAGTAPAAIVDAQQRAGDKLQLTVEPGNTEIERGAGLLVLARFVGPLPAEATLVFQNGEGETTRLAMTKSLDDPIFGTRIGSVDMPLDYHVELPGESSASYHVGVFEFPKLVQADAKLVFPSYTGLEEKLVQDVRTISAVEGTEVTLLCHLNKPVASAVLTEKDQEPIALVADAAEPNLYRTTLRLTTSRRWQLQLVDTEGRKNVSPPDIILRVTPNNPPDLKLAFPARDIEVSPLEETDVKATVYDDFGLTRYGLTYALAGKPAEEVVLGEGSPGKQKLDVASAIRFEQLQAQPDQLLSYHLWAEDIGPDGQPRRTLGDMYFAEVRHFEEIYRQGEQPPGGEQQRQQQQQQQAGGENAQAAEKLGELQKQIINATWKLIRRETGEQPTEPFADDVQLIYESQASALEQAQELIEKLEDPQSQAYAEVVARSMSEAWHQLEAAKAGPSAAPLTPALASEQAAYQALLKLRAHEHRVIQSQQQQSSSSSSSSSASSRAQQQLQQLQLKNEENRYETQRAAQSEQQQQQELQDRETRQVLNRLSELARRQNDLNDRLKELQAALEEAQTPAAQEEARQQLKRLRDEQQQILRDTDELQARMETPENQQRMAEASEQLQQTRDQVRQAAESLANEKVTQAAAEGTRAERNFQELRSEFRRQAADRFNDEMRQMRDDARQLDEKQSDLAQQLDQQAQASNAQPNNAQPNSAQTNRPQTADSKGTQTKGGEAKAGGEKAGDKKSGGQPANNAQARKSNRETKSLRDDGQREAISTELTEQKQRLTELLERMRQTIQDAEQSEPLLSEQLYDTSRKALQQNLTRSLDSAEFSVRRGLLESARDEQRLAQQGIGELREGVEKAAESVLGDDTEALRRAREELQRLSEELQNEIARNSPRSAQRPAELAQNDQAQPGQTGQPGQQGQQNPPGQRGEPGQNQNQPGQPGPQGQQGEQQPGQPGQQGQQPGQQSGQQGQQPGQQGQQGQGQQPGQGQPQDGQQGQPQGQGQPGNQPGSRTGQRGGGRLGDGPQRLGGPQQAGATEGGGNQPLTGQDFLNWSDRLRDVEEMVDDPQLRAEAARIREKARSIRAEFKRHSTAPSWDVVQAEVSEPLVELRDRVAEELLRRTAKDSLVPLDRDPVPPKYSKQTRRYYERLGSGQ